MVGLSTKITGFGGNETAGDNTKALKSLTFLQPFGLLLERISVVVVISDSSTMLPRLPNSYVTIPTSGRALLRVRGSKFIATAREVSAEEKAREIVRMVSAEFHDATHHCFAFKVGVGTRPTLGYSDAGEPSGTAGRPILRAIEERKLTNVVVVVSRYFGGTKLGAGGLARAYHQAAQNVLDSVGTVERQITEDVALKCAYPHVYLVKQVVSKYGGEVVREEYTDRVSMVVRLRRSRAEEFRASIQERADQKVEIEHERR